MIVSERDSNSMTMTISILTYVGYQDIDNQEVVAVAVPIIPRVQS